MAQSHIAPKIYIRRHHLHSQCGHSNSKEITKTCLREKIAKIFIHIKQKSDEIHMICNAVYCGVLSKI
jgi:hypothetical protein